MVTQNEALAGFQLSPQQTRSWELQQDDPGAVYSAQCAVMIEGALKPEMLDEALRMLVERHEILRTLFHRMPGGTIPVQVILDKQLFTRDRYDLMGLYVPEQWTKIEAVYREAKLLPFEFIRGPLLRVSLFNLSARANVLLIRLPSLCADVMGLKNLVSEISHGYEACLEGRAISEEAMQYADLAQWQNELLESTETGIGKEFWQTQDASDFPLLRLPFENLPTEKLTFKPEFLTATVKPELLQKIHAIAPQHSVSAPDFLLACWQILLWRLTGEADIVIAVSYDGRKYEELKEALGPFTKYIPLLCHLGENLQARRAFNQRGERIHCHLDINLRFSQVLKQINDLKREAYKWQEYFTWEHLTTLNDKGSAEAYFPPFSFDFDELPAVYSAGDVSFTLYKYFVCADRFKAKLSCIQKGESLETEFHYDSNIFPADEIKRLEEQFHVLVESALDDPERVVSELDILTDKEWQQVVVELNETQADFPEDSCLHALFEAQVARAPDNIAVIFEDQTLTYRELNERANRLAHHLRKLGVGPDLCVGLCMERSPELLIGILGILKAGGTYVPLDPTNPTSRLAYMLEDAQALALVTQCSLLEELPKFAGCTICIDTDWRKVATESAENIECGTRPDNLAYAIYTSGSTGRPKGVMIPHRGVVNYLSWCAKAYAVAEGRGALVHTSVSFDLTVTSLFSPLLVGRSVVLISEVEMLADALHHKADYSLLKVTPAHLSLLNQLLPEEDFTGRVKVLVVGGEALDGERLSYWQRRARGTRLINEYGPTETVVGCCAYEVPPDLPVTGSVPIGRPIANMEVYLLDDRLQPVPIGVPGHLHIGGVGLARGYLNQPALTAERFIPHPFSQIPGARLYKTGDMARLLPDGNLEFLGRQDMQVKVRGFRIELEEIEAVLDEHEMVREALVVARADESGEKQLVAYVVSERGQLTTATMLSSFLHERVPVYMIPQAFVFLSELPLTANGKVDRSALPAPGQARAETTIFIAPRDTLELQLARIWEDTLNVHPVGVMDNFFDLGGHSFLALRLMAQIQNRFGKNLPLSTLFHKGTIEHLADVLRQKTDLSAIVSPLVEIQPHGSMLPFFCVHPGGGNVLGYFELARHLGTEHPFYGLQALGLNDECEPLTSIEEMATLYTEALRDVQPEGPYHLGGHSFGGFVAYEMAQQMQQQGHEVALLAILDTVAPLFSDKPPENEMSDVGWMIMIAKVIERFLGKELAIPYDEFRALGPDEQLSFFSEQLKMVNFVPKETGLATIRGLLKVYKANDRAVRSYRPQHQVYAGQITLFKSSEPSPEDFREHEALRDDAALHWGEFSSQPVRIIEVPGDHITMLTEPYVQILAEYLRVTIDEAQHPLLELHQSA